jgi:hypothetical protein
VAALGGDLGTTRFISGQILAGNGTWRDNDRRVAQIAWQKMRANPAAVLKRIAFNLAKLPVRIIGLPQRVELWRMPAAERSVLGFSSRRFVGMPPAPAAAADLLLFGLGLGAIAAGTWRRDVASVVAAANFVYMVAFSTILVRSDHRYRGVVDVLLALFAIVAVRGLVSRIRKSREASPAEKWFQNPKTQA